MESRKTAVSQGIIVSEGLSLTPERLHQIDELNKLAAERGQTLAQMAFPGF